MGSSGIEKWNQRAFASVSYSGYSTAFKGKTVAREALSGSYGVKQRMRGSSPLLKARLAGGFYLLAVVSAVLAEALLRGRLLRAVGVIPIASFAIVTLLLYWLLRPVNRGVMLLAAILNFISLTLEALELHLRGANIALGFHGLHCLVVGFLVFRSDFLPRILGTTMAVAGLAWLTDLSIPLTNHLSPYNVIAGFAGEGMLMLWLLLVGLDGQKWQVRASKVATSHGFKLP